MICDLVFKFYFFKKKKQSYSNLIGPDYVRKKLIIFYTEIKKYILDFYYYFLIDYGKLKIKLFFYIFL